MNRTRTTQSSARCFTETPPRLTSRFQSSNSVSLFQSNYASSFPYGNNQDTDFSSPYSARARMYDLPSSSSTFGAPHHMSSSSTSSLTGIGLGGGGGQHHMSSMQQQMSGSNANNATTNLIVNYLPQDLAERELHSLFSAIGPVGNDNINSF